MPDELILAGGTIRTLDPRLPVADWVAVRGAELAASGSGRAPRRADVELDGRCVVPGLNDAHVHFPSWALARHELRLERARSLEAALELVAEAVASTPPGRWLRGAGWRDLGWTESPTRQALDRVAPDVPVALMARDHHSLWLNSVALARARGQLDVQGGVVERDAGGEPTGVLREEAAWAFRDSHSRPSLDELVTATRAGMAVANARGVTAIHDKDGWLGAFEIFARLRERDELTLRVWQSFPHRLLPELRAVGLRSGFGDELLRAGYVKVFMDGTLGSATARLLDGSGVEITTRGELEDITRRAVAAGFPVAVHAIGDAANRAALDAFEATRDVWAPAGLAPRIEHAQLLAPEDVGRFAGLGVAASVQFSHAPSDRDLADRLWEGRPGAYAYRSLLAAGTLLANGSDAPIEELDPLAGIRAAVLRTLDERPPWRPEQALSVVQALVASTLGPARLARDARRRGALSAGRLADLVVLDRDPVEHPDQLGELGVVATMLGGRWVHNPPPWT